jgi:hypothetical protein
LDRKGVYIALLVLLFVGLTIVISLGAFLIGRQTGTPVAEQGTPIFVPANRTPAANGNQADDVQVPIYVTNTPTVTPSPTSTVGPTYTPSPTNTPTPTPTHTPTPTPTPIVVITHINALGRLETTEFAMQTVVDLENEPDNIWEQIVGSDKLLLVAEGQVMAGFDLSKVNDQDIVVQGTTVTMNLPAPEILNSRIDNDQTYVVERDTGFLVKPDQTLESRARQIAEQSLTDWALEHGIIQKAEEYGRIQIENLLRSLGFTTIIINVKESEEL